MKPFDIELAKRGKPVCTESGKPVKIISFDRKNAKGYCIVALVEYAKDNEVIETFSEKGKNYKGLCSKSDLMMVSGKMEGWINVCRDRESNNPFCHHGKIFDTEENARAYLKQIATMCPKTFPNMVETVKIEWEE